MLVATVTELQSRGWTPTLVQTGPNGPQSTWWTAPPPVVDIHEFFCCQEAFLSEMAILRILRGRAAAVVLGADVLDGHYGDLRSERTLDSARLCAHASVPTRIVSFSISEEVSLAAVGRLHGISTAGVRLIARDPVSLRRLEGLGIRDAQLGADAAFLLKPAAPHELDDRLRAFLNGQKRMVVGVALHNVLMGGDETRIDRIALFSRALIELATHTHCKYVLLSHHPTDLPILLEIHRRIEEALPGRSFALPQLPHASAIKCIVGQCCHVISSRMHVAIAALGMATPVTCFAYFGKFEGLFEHFHLRDGLYSCRDLPPSSGAIARLLVNRLETSQSLRAHVQGQVERVLSLARRNLDGLDVTTDGVAGAIDGAIR